MTSFDTLASDYELGRLGYSNEVYNSLVAYGLSPAHKLLDVGCGTGLAGAPLIQNDYSVTGIDPSEPMLAVAKRQYPQATWVSARAEALPFEAASFDAAISAQAFHHVAVPTALAEIVRVLRPRGIIAIWWKNLMSDDPIKQLRDDVARELGFTPLAGGWRGGFKEFYAAGFSETAIRVLPWSTVTTLSRFLQYERSRKIVRETFGSSAEQYFAQLESRLRETFGEGDPTVPLSYMQFLYLAKK